MTAKTVSFFVVVFDRAERRMVKMASFDVESDAIQALFEAEDDYLNKGTANRFEVVLLGAESLDDLHITHARYFAQPSGHEHLRAL